jgi:hypothetical protein
MRQVRVPTPTDAWAVRCEGPFSPSAPNAGAARTRLDGALAGLPRVDQGLGTDGWTVVWESAVIVSGALLKVWVWCARSHGGDTLQKAIGVLLDSNGFAVRCHSAPASADSALRPQLVYLRSGLRAFGLEPRTLGMLAAMEVAVEDRTNVDLGHRFRFARQQCPACGVDDHPAALVTGFPGPELLLAAEMGEVAFTDGGFVDSRARTNARCRRCGADFVAH